MCDPVVVIIVPSSAVIVLCDGTITLFISYSNPAGITTLSECFNASFIAADQSPSITKFE